MSNLAEKIGFTYSVYATWNDNVRWELIDGVAYAMAAPSRDHQKASRNILTQLAVFLKGKKCEVYHAPFDVRLNADYKDNIVVQPDIVVVCDESKLFDGGAAGAPDFIIEILSPGSIIFDTQIKKSRYRQAGVKEYWIVDPFQKDITVYILNGGVYGKGTVYSEDDIIPVHTLPGCRHDMADVFGDETETYAEPEPRPETEIKYKLLNALKNNKMSRQQLKTMIAEIENEIDN